MHFKFAWTTGTPLDIDSPFTDVESERIWWREEKTNQFSLMDDAYRVGRVTYVMPMWLATPFWGENHQLFKEEEEAKAWLATMYRLR